MAYKIKNLESLKRRDPKLYAILKAAEDKASAPTEPQPSTPKDPTRSERPQASDQPSEPEAPRPHASEWPEREWVESPDVASAFWRLLRMAIHLGATLWVLIAFWPQSGDGWFVVGCTLLYINAFAYGAGWLLTALFSNIVERVLPTGGGEWVDVQRDGSGSSRQS